MNIERGEYERSSRYYSRLIKDYGFSPGQILDKEGLAVSTVYNHLHKAIREGFLTPHEIRFAIDKEKREKIEKCILKNDSTSNLKIRKALEINNKSDNLELQLYLDFRDIQVPIGTLYENIREIEIKIHSSLRKFLVNTYGDDDREWWRKGIPEKVRSDLAVKYEKDETPADHPYCYTTLIQLDIIIEKNIKDLKLVLPKNVLSNRKSFSKKIRELNRIRNYVMHPVKGIKPTEKDYIFVKNLLDFLELDKWP